MSFDEFAMSSLMTLRNNRGMGQVATSFDLCREMISHIPTKVLKNPKSRYMDPCCGNGSFIIVLTEVLSKWHSPKQISKMVVGCDIDPTNIATAHIMIGDKYDIQLICCDSLEYNWDMKFDVVIGNPPFNSGATQRKGTNHRGQGDNLAKKFAMKGLALTSQYLFFIMPYGHRTYSSKLAVTFRENGLNRIDDVGEHFPNIQQVALGAFYFDKNNVVDTVFDAFTPKLALPVESVTQQFSYTVQPGKSNRADFESQLKASGKYKIIVTTSVEGYTDNQTIVDNMQDRSTGSWRVVVNCTTSKSTIGKIVVARPQDILTKSVNCFYCGSKQEAEQLKKHLEQPIVNDILSQVKTTMSNSAKFLRYIPGM